MVGVLAGSVLLAIYSYDLGRRASMLDRYSAQVAAEIAAREIARLELQSADRDFVEREAARTEDNPVTAEEYYILGVQAFLAEEHNVAQARFTAALKLRPDWANIYLARGRSFSDEG